MIALLTFFLDVLLFISLTTRVGKRDFHIFLTYVVLILGEVSLFEHIFISNSVILLSIILQFLDLLHFQLDLVALEAGGVTLHGKFSVIFSLSYDIYICVILRSLTLCWISLLLHISCGSRWRWCVLIFHFIHCLDHTVELLPDVSAHNFEVLRIIGRGLSRLLHRWDRDLVFESCRL